MVGFGYDVHVLDASRKLFVGGVEIPTDLGCIAHSDGDFLLHAICDALLGAAGLGDIGEHFPDTDEKYRGISSLKLLEVTAELVKSNGYEIINIDCMILLEKPKISPYKEEMRNNISRICGIDFERVNVKATTSEKLGFIGKREGAAAYAVCQIEKKG